MSRSSNKSVPVLGVVLILLGILGPLLLQRILDSAPNLWWHIVMFTTVLLGLLAIGLSGPVWTWIIARSRRSLVFASLVVFVIAMVSGAWWWLFVKTLPVAPRFEFGVFRSTAEYPEGLELGGISWCSRYGDLRVQIYNRTDVAFEDVKLLLRPDVLVAAIGQVSDIPDVTFNPWGDKVEMEVLRPTGGRWKIPLVHIATELGYWVKCPRLTGHSHVEIVMATVTKAGNGDEPVSDPYDHAYRSRWTMTDSVDNYEGGVWFGYADRPDSVFAGKASARFLMIRGTFAVSGHTVMVSDTMEVKDVIGDAFQEIMKTQRR